MNVWRWLSLALVIGCSGCGRDAEPDYGPNWARVTYNNGQSCLLLDWSFDYHAAYRPRDRKQGPYVVHHYSDRYLHEKDATLRVYDATGQRLEAAPEGLRELRRTLDCDPGAEAPAPEPEDPDKPGSLNLAPRPKCRVLRTYLTTDEHGKVSMTPVSPSTGKKRRPNALVPAADHFWPEHFSGSHREFRKVSVRLAGRAAPDCQHQTAFNLSVVESSAPKIERIEFHRAQ